MNLDLAIIGAGPAGCAAALTLRRRRPGLRVGLLDPDEAGPSGPQLGEHLDPSSLPLLRWLGLDDAIDALDPLSRAGVTAWGRLSPAVDEALFASRDGALQFDWAPFVSALRQRTEQRGTTLLRERVERVERIGEVWVLHTRGPDGRARHTARALIDASGRTSPLHRQLGAQRSPRDRLTAVVAWIDAPGELGLSQHVIEARAEGWWYAAPCAVPPANHPDRVVVALMSDSDLIQERGLHQPSAFRAALLASPLLHPLAVALSQAPQPLVPCLRGAASQHLEPAGGTGWLAAGDALIAFDPITGAGLDHALTSGRNAAQALIDWLEGDARQQQRYRETAPTTWRGYLEQQHRVYALEPRWRSAPFWARRA